MASSCEKVRPTTGVSIEASLPTEVDAVSVAWLARVRCAAFWFRILHV